MNTCKNEEETYEKNKKICKLCSGGVHGRKLAGECSGRNGIGGRTREVVSAEATETDAEALDEMQEAVYDESEADADGFKWNGTAIVGYVGKGGDVKIPEKCTSIGSSAFKGCDNLTSIVIPKGVTSIGSFAFMDCTGMASVEMPEGVTSIGHHAFWGCYKLKNIEIPVSVTSIGKYAFYDCSRFADINIPRM